jgi:hypothetical protein
MKIKFSLILFFTLLFYFILTAKPLLSKKIYTQNKDLKSLFFTKKDSKSTNNDTINSVQIGTIPLSDEFKSLLFLKKNKAINIFKYTVPHDGNILLSGFVAAGTMDNMLYTRLIKNGEIISQKTCGKGSPLFNGYFNYQTLVSAGDELCIAIVVLESDWQLHCCPDLYSCTYIFSPN